MKPTVYSTYRMSDNVREFIETHCELKIWEKGGEIPKEKLLEEIAEVDGLLTSSASGVEMDDSVLSHGKNLKVVSNVSVGYNNFDVEAMKKRNIVGTNTPGVLDETVADLAFSLILAAGRRIVELDKFVKSGEWVSKTKYEETFGKDVHNSTLGIIGMGRIGEAIARRAKFGFEMDVLYYNRNRKVEAEEKYDAQYCALDDLLKRADYILLMTPLTDETYQMIGTEQFKLMKKSAIFVNVSRGQTIDEKALIEALKNGEIQGAALDVFDQEPVQPDNPLLQMDNVVTTPHIGSATSKTEEAMAMKAAENLVAVLTGGNAKNPVWHP